MTLGANIFLTYAPLIALNILSLMKKAKFDTQLEIIMVESATIALLSICIGLYEHFVMAKLLIKQRKLYSTFTGNKPLRLKRVRQIKKTDSIFIERKLNDLMYMFGKRMCKSNVEDFHRL